MSVRTFEIPFYYGSGSAKTKSYDSYGSGSATLNIRNKETDFKIIYNNVPYPGIKACYLGRMLRPTKLSMTELFPEL
jgi:hypothetical protein